jgi:hypothetical protein
LTTPLAPPSVDAQQEPREPRWRFWPVLAIAGMGIALLVVYVLSQLRSPIRFGHFSHPPIYGRWDPTLDNLALVVIPAGLALAAAGWWVTSTKRVPAWLGLAIVVVCGVATAAAIGLVRGDWHDLVRVISTNPTVPYYTSDLHFVYEYGVRGFVERHPGMTAEFHAYGSKTHPAGIHLVLYGLFELFGASNTLRITTAIAVLATSAAGAAWLMGRTLGGERAGRIAAVLFVAAPGPLMLAYTGMDAIFAVFLSTAAALFVLAIHRRSAAIAAAAGGVLALGTLLTFATVFVGLAATIAILIQARGVRNALHLLGGAAVGGLAVLVLARLALGFDVWAAYQASPQAGRAYDPYWIIGGPSAWLMWAGPAVAALGVAGLLIKVPGARRPILPIALVLIMVIWVGLPTEITKLRPGEIERTWAFVYPVMAAVAGVVVDRWTKGKGRWSGAIVAGLVLLSVAQTFVLQSFWDNLQ